MLLVSTPSPPPTSPGGTTKALRESPRPRPTPQHLDPPSTANNDIRAQWAELITAYRTGEAATDGSPDLEPPTDLFDPATDEDDRVLRGEKRGSPQYCRSWYRKYNYLPALANPREEERQQTLHRYGLHQKAFQKLPAVRNLVELAKVVFGCQTCIVTVVLENTVQFVATTNEDAESDATAAMHNTWEASYCPHAISKSPDQGPFVVEDALKDFRFARAPLQQRDGIRFFASANINLASPGKAGNLLPVGSFCILDSSPRAGLTAEEQQTLARFSDLAAKELELAYQQEQNALAQKRTDYISDLFKSLLVYSSRSLATTKDRCTVDEVARNLVYYTKSDFGFILDCRSLNTATSSVSATHSSRLDPGVHGWGSVQAINMYCGDDKVGPEWDPARKDYLAMLEGEEGLEPVVQALDSWHKDQRTTFSGLDKQTVAISPLLPAGTRAAIVTPVFDHEGEPALLLVLGSYEPFRVFEEADERFVASTGAIALTSLQKDKILAADRAKLQFVSQVSHELRTPLHSVRGVLDLVREISTPEALAPITSLLDVAEVSVHTLHDILEDCLEHAKLSNHDSRASVPAPKVTECSLGKLVIEVLQSCARRAKQAAAITDENGAVTDQEDVKLFFESQLPPDLIAQVDVGGLKRVVINLVGNAIKFTDAGSITVRLSEVLSPSSTAQRTFRLEVVDTGCGIDETFLKEDLFTAFKQKNAFSAGAGLGLSLSAQIVRRMKGTIGFTSKLGVGTTATVTIPLEVIEMPFPISSRSSSLPSSTRIAISDLLSYASPACTPAPSPAPAAASSFSPLPPSPSIVASPSAMAQTHSPAPEKSPSALRVLVVDDNAIARRVLATWLRTKKYEYVEASGGAEAIELFETFAPNLVWCDIQMPEIDGIEATRQMRIHEKAQGWPKARIIALSGLDSTLGGNDHVLKNGQVCRWIVKGGPFFKVLAADMTEFEKSLKPNSSGSSFDSGYGSSSLSADSKLASGVAALSV